MEFPSLLNKKSWAPRCRLPKPPARIKESEEDFIVEEITGEGRIIEVGVKRGFLGGEGDFLCIEVEKKGWATDLLAKKIAKQLGISKKRVSFAGTKDKRALTAQVFSIYMGKPEDVEKLKIRDVNINAWWLCDGVKIGDLKGNRFTVALRDFSEECLEGLKGKFPNYFGEQRFGRGHITHKVGYAMVKGDFEQAVKLYLSSTTSSKEEVLEAKKELSETWDYRKALRAFPSYLKHERTLLAHLSQHPNDYVNALRKLPRPTLLMFVHALQSFMFNEYLERRDVEEEGERRCGSDILGFPDQSKSGDEFLLGEIVGYESKINNLNRAILEELELQKEDFLLKSLPEVSAKGTWRVLFAPVVGFESLEGAVRFSLPAGSYATVFLREIVELV